ncbi:MAG: PLP-dependent aspartate aminotransferase family protein [Isosphaeraceae bacterium]
MPSPPPDPARPDTACARPPRFREPDRPTPPLAPPIVLSSVFQVADLDQIDAIYEGGAAGYFYARDGHPNRSMLEAKAAGLEATEAALVCGSGMGAEAALFLSVLSAGDHVVLSDGIYGRTVSLVDRELRRFGIESSTFDANDAASLRPAMRANTRMVFVETISNPLVRVADLPSIAAIAGKAGVLFAVDNTFAPCICRPAEHGADFVSHSATKLIGGHSDVTMGLLCGAVEPIRRAANVGSCFGMTGNAFDCWLTLRGFSTLAVRSSRACANALGLAESLAGHPEVRAVHYPGLESHPDHPRARRLLQDGFGAILTVDLGDRSRASAFIRALKHIPFAPSLGDVCTTLSHPATTSHRFQTAEQWVRQGITPGLIRLSVGIEDLADLRDDIGQALGAIPSQGGS